MIESRIGMRPSFDVLISRLCLVAKRLIDAGIVDPEDVLNPDKVLKLLGEKQQTQTASTSTSTRTSKMVNTNVTETKSEKTESNVKTRVLSENHQETAPLVVIENVTESESESAGKSEISDLPRYLLNNPWIDIIRLRSRSASSTS